MVNIETETVIQNISTSQSHVTPAPALLTVKDLSVTFDGQPVVRNIDLSVAAGSVLGIVGESGSGKSVAMLGLMGLIEAPGKVSAKEIIFNNCNLLTLNQRARRALLGQDMAIIFQDALSSLNPSYTVGDQIAEVLRQHVGLRGDALKNRVLALLERVEIPDARNRIHAFPHQLSGGMNQRIMIAMAIACGPKLLIADEPTTALDVTIQAQVMQLLRDLQREQNMALILISHDLAVVAEIAERVAVMYAGEIVESNPVPAIFNAPRHPYTASLLAAIPEHNRNTKRLFALSGSIPGPQDVLPGCRFAPRCEWVEPKCQAAHPPLAWPIYPKFVDNAFAESDQITSFKTSNQKSNKANADIAGVTIDISNENDNEIIKNQPLHLSTDFNRFNHDPIGPALVRCIKALNENQYHACLAENVQR